MLLTIMSHLATASTRYTEGRTPIQALIERSMYGNSALTNENNRCWPYFCWLYFIDSIFILLPIPSLLLLFLCYIYISIAIFTATLPFFVRRISPAFSIIGTHFLYVCLSFHFSDVLSFSKNLDHSFLHYFIGIQNIMLLFLFLQSHQQGYSPPGT